MRPVEAVRKIMPGARAEFVKAFEISEPLFVHYGVTTPIRMAHFIGQFGGETGGGEVLFENLNYTSAQRLLQIFGAGNHTAAITPVEVPYLLNNPRALAERVYGLGNPRKAKELGNTRPGDGYLFRGTGVIQMTGGYNFKKAGEKVGVDFYGHPSLAVAPEHLLKAALWEWDKNRCNQMADANDILGISKAINLGNPNAKKTPNGMAHRREWFNKAWALLKDQNLTLTASGVSTAPIAKRETQPTKPLDPNFGKPTPPPPPTKLTPKNVGTVLGGAIAGGSATAAAYDFPWAAILTGAGLAILLSVVVVMILRNRQR